MARYTLRNEGYRSYKRIFQARRAIGRVYRSNDGTYVGLIGSVRISGHATEIIAFSEVVARHCGFESAREFEDHNRNIRAQNRARRRADSRASFEALLRRVTSDRESVRPLPSSYTQPTNTSLVEIDELGDI